jgi:hypothetical protein
VYLTDIKKKVIKKKRGKVAKKDSGMDMNDTNQPHPAASRVGATAVVLVPDGWTGSFKPRLHVNLPLSPGPCPW